MEPAVVGELGVEGDGQQPGRSDRNGVATDLGEHLDLRPVSLDPGRADEDCAHGLLAETLDSEILLEAVQLAAEGIPAARVVREAEVRGCVLDAVRAYCTEGEIMGAMVDVFGIYTEKAVI